MERSPPRTLIVVSNKFTSLMIIMMIMVVDYYRNDHYDEYDDHLVDVEVETLLDPALRLLELLFEVHHLNLNSGDPL